MSEELIGEDVRVTVHHKPNCLVEFYVKASPRLMAQGKKQAVKAVSTEKALPGFRPGKAPADLIEKKFPHDLKKHLHQTIADLSFPAAQAVAKIPVLNNHASISFNIKEENSDGVELVFTFETEPTIPPIDMTLFKASPVDRSEVTEQQIEEAIRQMRFFYAEWTPISDRAVQEGDFILIDLDTIEGDTTQNVFHHIRFEVVPEKMANWMRTLVLNAKAGDVLEGMSEPDSTASDQDKEEFKPKKVRLHLLKVEQAKLPELDDAFAKKVGAPDVAAMRISIAEVLNKHNEEKGQSALRSQVNEFLTKTYLFDLPASLIEGEIKHRHGQRMKDPEMQKTWEAMSPPERRSQQDLLHQEAIQALRLYYLSRQVVRQANLPVTHKEVQQEAVAMCQTQGQWNIDVDKISKETYAMAISRVILRKAQDHLLHAAKSTSIPK